MSLPASTVVRLSWRASLPQAARIIPRQRHPRLSSLSTVPRKQTACLACRLRGCRRWSSTSSSNNGKPTTQPSDTRNQARADDALPSSPEASPEAGSVSHTTTTSTSSSSAELPSAADSRRSALAARISTFMDRLQNRAVTATQKLNDLTGYSAIEAIKAQNAALEAAHGAAQARLRAARAAYKQLNAGRAATQREVTTLLARKDSWGPADLERFTALYRADHAQEAQVAGATAELAEAEADEGRLAAALNSGILRRYHEEQVWSDRIRRQSTWGTWGLMGVNILLFLGLQFVAEPWRRQRLMRSLAAEERGAFEEVRRELEEVKTVLSSLGTAGAAASGAAAVADVQTPLHTSSGTVEAGVADMPQVEIDPDEHLSTWELLLRPESWQSAVMDLGSERRIGLRMRDASLIALESALAGAAAAALAVLLVRRT